jgi:uncharacterized membrane protein
MATKKRGSAASQTPKSRKPIPPNRCKGAMMLASIMLMIAQVRGAPRGQYPVLAFVVLGLVVGVGIVLAYLLKREAKEEEQPVTDADLLAQFERARFAGEMDEEEFQRVSAALQRRMSAAGTPAKPAASKQPRQSVPGAGAQAEPVAGPDPAPNAEPPNLGAPDQEPIGPQGSA